MADEYTPTTDEVRLAFALSKDDRDPNGYNARYATDLYTAEWHAIRDAANAEFDRWLAAHDAEVARAAEVRALRGAHAAIDLRHAHWHDLPGDDGEPIVRDNYSTTLDYAEALAKSWLRDRANRVEKGDNDG